jgi:hypothetical protein
MPTTKMAPDISGPPKAAEDNLLIILWILKKVEVMSSKPMVGVAWALLILITVAAIEGGGPGMVGSAGAAADNQMIAAARSYVTAHSAPGITFDLILLKQVNNYALLEARPKGKWANQAEPAGVILQKIGGQWAPRTMGTDLSDWERRVPELFK